LLVIISLSFLHLFVSFIDYAPAFFSHAIKYLSLNEERLSAEGLFRISGNSMAIDDYMSRLDQGEDVDFSDCQDIHTVSGYEDKR
jgi:hypothetical protein